MTTRRYLFVFYSQLDVQQLDLFGQVADKIYVFVSEEVIQLPIKLAIKLQKLGKSLKWVIMESDDLEDRRMHLAFQLGKLHKKLPTDIEFAVVSNEEDYDGVIAHLNRARRKCQRVRTHEEIAGEVTSTPSLEPVLFESELKAANGSTRSIAEFKDEPTILQSAEVGVMHAAAKVRERMLRSGNRPAELELLKEYIILSSPNLQPAAADRVIDHLANNREIEIENREVVYHF